MDQQQMLMMLPDLQPDELVLIQSLTKDMTDSQQQQFFMLFKSKRKEKKDLLILTLIGFFGVAGLQRFVVGETGMGILYLVTIGFCGIGTIIDLVNLDSMVSKFNQKQAMDTANMVRMLSKQY
jgi:TM2 domain-containing membrane protein YozV